MRVCVYLPLVINNDMFTLALAIEIMTVIYSWVQVHKCIRCPAPWGLTREWALLLR